ncbi:MAG: sugar ABC transporter ATP-binding protein [Bryobacterales bacterium]|nr:sugar ABC transporter ATP-binding protein [Bryobacteraceae bacterium]MDW8129387.1 sugar ABC transporter ATP-binding protein [Bryobacterales bacterium]
MLLELRGIRKRFGGIEALRNGNLAVQGAEVHALVGENGAGKSTMARIIAGMVAPDGGEFLWRGRPVRFPRPADAAAQGIAMVHQESLLAPHLSVAENIFLGREPRLPLGWIDRRRLYQAAARLIEEHRFPLQPDWRVERLNPAGRQLVEICRAIQHGSSLLIFDEPTSALSEAETVEVFRIVRQLRERGMGVLYITHRLEELRAIGDRITVLRDGETVFSGPLAEVGTEQIIRHMVGRELAAIYERKAQTPGEELLRVERLTRRPALDSVSFSVRAGEIVGVAGLVGAGRTELLRAIFGLDPVESGRVWVAGREARIRHPRDALRAGLALIPEDRQRSGLAIRLPLAWNLTLAALPQLSRWGFLLAERERQVCEEFTQRLRIRAGSLRQPVGRLSGGTQQKVVIAKWLLARARVFLFDEPTRGIDVGAKIEVFQLMDELARNGAAVLMVSSELPEIVQVADRILVMRQGRITAELPRGASQEEIMRFATLHTQTALRGNREAPTEEETP